VHPAYSVIVFTTASGAGYGLLVWLALSRIVPALGPPDGVATLISFAVSFALITVGLISSTLHLGRPERAWRAMSQWRTSWLSREGVLAIVTYPIAGLFGLVWFLSGGQSGWLGLLAVATTAFALATLYCTGMIYACLATVRAWYRGDVPAIYIALGLATGGILFNLLGVMFAGSTQPAAIILTLAALAAAFVLKSQYWSSIDTAARSRTMEAATGLGTFGKVRTLDPPHSRANFVMREMGFEVARKHAMKLRQLVQVALFAIPAVCLILALLIGGALVVALMAVSTVSAAIGVLTERWLFFAEAEHVVTLYYGRDVA
jgi:sulfite dehydrogenase (quinone) subunit SoeC